MIIETIKHNVMPVIMAAIWAVVVSMGNVSVAGAEEEHGDEHGEELVVLSQRELQEFGIEVATAGPGVVQMFRTLPAEVRINENQLAHIVPRYDGIATDVFVNIGDAVKVGQVLAIVESDESLATYELVSSIAGTVVEKHMTRGEPVDREESGFMIADLTSVWIDITVYQRDLDLITIGREATVTAGSGEGTIVGTIGYVTPIVDPHTRTATARMEIENPVGRWRPGMFAMADVLTESFAAGIVVPFSAVHTVEERDVVFVVDGEGFAPRSVSLGRRGKTHFEISSGLMTGEQYVAVGGFTLKAELGKDSFGEGHGH